MDTNPVTLVYFDKKDADFLSHSLCTYTEEFEPEIHKGEMPNGAGKLIIHFYSDQLSALTAYKIFDELHMNTCLVTVANEWAVIVDDPERHAALLNS